MLAAGDLDLTYGASGIALADLGRADEARAMVAQSDGRVIVAGETGSGNGGDWRFALARFDATGALDSSFGSNGKIIADLGGNSTLSAIALQPDGKLLLSGFAGGLRKVARFNDDGSLDGSFGVAGQVTLPGSWPTPSQIIVQPDGKFLFVGNVQDALSTFMIALARFNTDGTADASFGSNGLATAYAPNSNDFVSAAAIQPDGRIVVVGGTGGYSHSRLVLARFTSSGQLDPTFGSGGETLTRLAPDVFNNPIGGAARGVQVQDDGTLLVAAATHLDPSVSQPKPAVLRYTSAGLLDTSFGTGGECELNTSVYDTGKMPMAIQADHKIVLAYEDNAYGTAFGLGRITADGQPDGTFGTPPYADQVGIVRIKAGYGGAGVAIAPDGNIVEAGYASETSPNLFDFELVKVLSGASPGADWATLGPDGTLTVSGTANSDGFSLGVSNGTLTVARNADSPQTFPADAVKTIVLSAGAGSDGVQIGAGLPPTTLDLGDGNDQVTVLATPVGAAAGGPISILGGAGTDIAYCFGPGPDVSFDGGDGSFDQLNIIGTDVASSGIDDFFTIHSSSVHRSTLSAALPDNNYTFSNVESLLVSGHAGNDQFLVIAPDMTAPSMRINGDSGNDEVDITAAPPGKPISVYGGDGNDLVSVGPNANASVSFDSGNGTDQVNINGSTGDDVFTVTNSSISDGSSAISYAGTSPIPENVTIYGDDGNDIFNVSSTASNITFLTGGNGNDTFNVAGTGSLGPIKGSLILDGFNGVDRAVFTDASLAVPVTYNLSADAVGAVQLLDIDNVSLTAGSAADTFNLTPSPATAFAIDGGAGSAQNKLNIDASSAGSVLLAALPPDGGTYTFGNALPVTFSRIQWLKDVIAPTVTARFSAAAPSIGPQSLSVTFSEPLSAPLTVAALTIIDNATGNPVSPDAFAYDSATHTATATFAQPLPDSLYTATLDASQIADVAGNALDGNGDGAPGDNFTFNFIPIQPTAVTASATSGFELQAHWLPLAGASLPVDGLTLQRSINGGPFLTIATLPPDALEFDDNGLDPGTLYTYRVQTFRGTFNSAWSPAGTVMTFLPGDVDGNYTIDLFDIAALLASKYNTGQAATWADGDQNGDGVVDFFDITEILASNYNTGPYWTPPAPAAVPSASVSAISAAVPAPRTAISAASTRSAVANPAAASRAALRENGWPFALSPAFAPSSSSSSSWPPPLTGQRMLQRRRWWLADET
jgi:uncharacterized delta-60 repeat protein